MQAFIGVRFLFYNIIVVAFGGIKMKFKQAFNNNVALAVDAYGNEVVVMGKAIGFQKKDGDELDEAKVEKSFFLGDSLQDGKLMKVLKDIPIEIVLLTDKLIHLGEDILEKQMNKSILFTLSDHINCAIFRAKQGIDFGNPLQWEIKRLYLKEYRIGKQALDIIKNELHVELPQSEASLIALHFVNAAFDNGKMQEILQMTEVISHILNIVNDHFKIKLDEDSLNYSRFLTHLQYFILRQINKKTINISGDNSLFELINKSYPKSFNCVVKIKVYLHKEFNWEITDDEMGYLVLHIQRVTS